LSSLLFALLLGIAMLLEQKEKQVLLLLLQKQELLA
jgi:hypothetical protein